MSSIECDLVVIFGPVEHRTPKIVCNRSAICVLLTCREGETRMLCHATEVFFNMNTVWTWTEIRCATVVQDVGLVDIDL